ncbi:uncharacterized protein LOC108034442 [Drosophila biarmipes]|uniref:uncharacterized protein LOC108034442 n=1 Tax=Drosophila biarmipes TaxID=125945 RepID=UPI001CDB342B|nr:uncharacterized protein LOC108034442 [Drosophila biarmipes]
MTSACRNPFPTNNFRNRLTAYGSWIYDILACFWMSFPASLGAAPSAIISPFNAPESERSKGGRWKSAGCSTLLPLAIVLTRRTLPLRQLRQNPRKVDGHKGCFVCCKCPLCAGSMHIHVPTLNFQLMYSRANTHTHEERTPADTHTVYEYE